MGTTEREREFANAGTFLYGNLAAGTRKLRSIWKAANPASSADNINMYAALWTNGPSHCTEFSDYTYDEHFGGPVSVNMKRADILGYMLGRVQKNCPDSSWLPCRAPDAA